MVPVWSTLDPGAFALTVASLVAMLRFGVGMGHTLLASAILGAAYWAWRHGGI